VRKYFNYLTILISSDSDFIRLYHAKHKNKIVMQVLPFSSLKQSCGIEAGATLNLIHVTGINKVYESVLKAEFWSSAEHSAFP
jgi:hypothetical protein